MAALPTHLSQGASEIKDTCLRLARQQLHSKPPRASPRSLIVPTEPEPIDPMVTPGPPLSLMMRCLHSGPSQSSGVIVAITATNCSIPSSVFSLNTFSFPDSPVLESGDLVVAESVAGLFLSLVLWSSTNVWHQELAHMKIHRRFEPAKFTDNLFLFAFPPYPCRM